MTSAVRFAAANARLRAMKRALWMPADLPLLLGAGLQPDGRPLAGSLADVFPPLVAWYETLVRLYPSGADLFRALLRLHETDNLKLLWRSAVRGRVPALRCWRPLGPLATIAFEPRVLSPDELVRRLGPTPYGTVVRGLVRSHGADLAIAEIGLDRWAWSVVDEEARRLPAADAPARRLVRLLLLEHDAALLERGVRFGLDADLVAKSTVVLSRECGPAALVAAAAWRPGAGPLGRVLPRPLRAFGAPLDGWPDLRCALRRARRRACRRAFVSWPFQLAPAVAAILLRSEQARAAESMTAAREAGQQAAAALTPVLAAGPLEA